MSPPWSTTTKLVVSLTVVAIAAGLFIQFHGYIGLLLLAFALAYLLNPIAGVVQRRLRISWGISATIVYLLLLLLLLSLLTLGGLGLIGQISSLVAGVETNLGAIPQLLHDLSNRVIDVGPFQFDLRHVDMSPLSSQMLNMLQSALGRTGTIISTVASGAATLVSGLLFVMLISYFVLLGNGGPRTGSSWLDVPGYSDDVRRLTVELNHIWNAFLRGQVIIFLLTAISYLVVMGVLGIRYAIGIAILGGLAKFLPYFGPFITWATLAIVAYFQPYTLFGLSPVAYTLLAVGLGIVIDQAFDNFVSPRIMGQALNVHPAAVLVAAIIAASWLGLLGVILAAPMLATVQLLWRYTMRKMLDLDPWPAGDSVPPPPPGAHAMARVRRFVRDQVGRLTRSV